MGLGAPARRLAAALRVAALGPAMLAAFGDDSGADETSPTAEATATTTDPDDAERAVVITAYEDAVTAAGRR